ncbi:uncharacterized protein DUF3429 [Stella humosa]|uniref:Uncharacterized protein DUF3429 n=1 Tax=Stella humosa TaxID=94 RepID=A0A3N1KZR4_9PROT|nr:DUF3429 domain-containing protein [Stella humosa]ROP84279.1 uncharacterized protein DUF3429 [Stella humosa]BBK33792.1 hypothetical protein STHU_44260 [Stella humosa]
MPRSHAARPNLADVPRPALILGFLGLIPFVAGAAGAWVLEAGQAGLAIPLQFFYASAVLSFLGAVHWGLAIGDFGPEPNGTSWGRLGWSVIPALAGWLLTALEFEPVTMGTALTIAFPIVLVADIVATRRGLAPDWYPALRIPLTVIATLALAASTLRFVFPPGA